MEPSTADALAAGRLAEFQGDLRARNTQLPTELLATSNKIRKQLRSCLQPPYTYVHIHIYIYMFAEPRTLVMVSQVATPHWILAGSAHGFRGAGCGRWPRSQGFPTGPWFSLRCPLRVPLRGIYGPLEPHNVGSRIGLDVAQGMCFKGRKVRAHSLSKGIYSWLDSCLAGGL